MQISKNVLRQYVDLVKEREEVRQRIENLEDQIARIEREGYVVDKVTGGEGGIQSYRIEGFPYPEYERKKLLLMMRKHRMCELETRILESVDAVEEFVNGIEDSYVRRIIICRVVNRLTWNDIADEIGGNNTAEGVRKVYERFLAKNL